jgi:hypothetical protein
MGRLAKRQSRPFGTHEIHCPLSSAKNRRFVDPSNGLQGRLWLVRVALSFLFASALVGIPARSIADKTLTPTLDMNLVNQPVAVNSCPSKLLDVGSTSNDTLQEHVTFTNTSTRNVLAVELEFDVYDAFDDHLANRAGIWDTPLPSGNSANVVWNFAGFSEQPAFTVRCYVTQVRFADGTRWTRPTSP